MTHLPTPTTGPTANRSSRHRTVVRSAALASVLAIGGGLLAVAPASAASPSAAVASSTSSTATGSVSVDMMVGATHVSGSRVANVTCRRSGSTYTVTTNRTTVDGVQVRGNVVIRNDTGPGTYTATVSLTLKGAGIDLAGAVRGVQVSVTDDGGSWSFSRTASGNRFPKLQGTTISGTLSYACNV